MLHVTNTMLKNTYYNNNIKNEDMANYIPSSLASHEEDFVHLIHSCHLKQNKWQIYQ